VIFSSLFLLSLIFYEIFLVGIGFDNSNFIPNFQVEMLFLACLFVCLFACLLSFFFVSREFQWKSNYKQARVIAHYLAPPYGNFKLAIVKIENVP
jgi:predicted permease